MAFQWIIIIDNILPTIIIVDQLMT
jgi:hypothetical protein